VLSLAAAIALVFVFDPVVAAPFELETIMPALSRKPFFDSVRADPCGGKLTQEQVDGMQTILKEWERWHPRGDLRHLAYMLATTFHETGGCMQPVREGGGEKYLKKYDTGRLAAVLGNTPAADGDGIVFAGRGYVQITGFRNYAKASAEIGVDFIADPDAALIPENAAKILFRGMLEGWFTGRKLSDFFKGDRDDPVGARKIVNGTDQARLIAKYHRAFLKALRAATPKAKATKSPTAKTPLKPTDPSPAPRGANPFLAALADLFRKPS
jgi:hypothetical protein